MRVEDLNFAFAGPRHEESLPALFERCSTPCFCQYWHFEGNSHGWQQECAHSPSNNQEKLQRGLHLGTAQGQGVVAEAQTQVVGWMKLTPAKDLPKLYAQRLYRNLPCFSGKRDGIWTIGCFVIDPEWRGRKVAHALVREGVKLAKEKGASAIESFPRRTEAAADHELWTGPHSVFERAGFEEIHTFHPYPVLRLSL